MLIAHTIDKHNGKPLYRVMTATVAERLSEEETHEAFIQLHEKMKTPDPGNPNLWVVKIAGYKMLGILNSDAGPSIKNILTLLFPEDD